jgi:hypothetical protein
MQLSIIPLAQNNMILTLYFNLSFMINLELKSTKSRKKTKLIFTSVCRPYDALIFYVSLYHLFSNLVHQRSLTIQCVLTF